MNWTAWTPRPPQTRGTTSQEIDALSDTVIAEYTYGPGYIDDVVCVQRNGQDYYHHTNQRNSTIAVTDETGLFRKCLRA